MTTSIPWVLSPDGSPGESWNPTTGCSHGCPYCYARVLHDRRHAAGMKGYEAPFNQPRPMPDRLATPLRRRRPTGWFVDSMGDLFDPAIPDEYIAAVFGVMAACPRHRFYVLTKQSERMAEWYRWVVTHEHPEVMPFEIVRWPLPNVWIGVSVENQADADARIPLLLQVPAAVRFVSVEPMLGEVDFTHMDVEHHPAAETLSPIGAYWINALSGKNKDMGRPCPDVPRLGWVICGPENIGRVRQPMPLEWAENLYRQCRAAGVPFFWKPTDGMLPREVPHAE